MKKSHLVLFLFLAAAAWAWLVASTLEKKLSEPPELTIFAGNQRITAALGTYSWHSVESDSGPPSFLVRNQEPLTVKPRSAIILSFASKPESYTVYTWSGGLRRDEMTGRVLRAPEQKGEIIYSVSAYWNPGSAHYAFAVIVEDND